MATMMILSVLLSFSCLLATTSAFVVFSTGFCPSIPSIPNFDLARYLGRWYNYENFDAPYQLGFSCVTATYDTLPGGKISVLNEGYQDITVFGRIMHRRNVAALGEAVILNPSNQSQLYVSFGDQPNFSITTDPRPNYQIVDTDYENYSLVYSCSQFPFVPIKIEAAWILSRYRANRPAKTSELKATLENYGVEIKNFKRVDQNKC